MNVIKLSGTRILYNSFRKANARYISISATRRRIFEVSDEDEFNKKVLSAQRPVVVDFYASWCGPCKTLDPILREEVGKLGDKVDLVKVDVDKLPEVAMNYDVNSIPFVIGFDRGTKKFEFLGALSQEEIANFLKEL